MGKLSHLSIFFFTLAKNSISCFYWLQFLVFCIVLTFFLSFSSAVVLTVSAAFLYAVTLLLTGLSSALVKRSSSDFRVLHIRVVGPHPLRNWELKQIKTSLFTVGELRGRSSLLLEAVLAGVSDTTEKQIRKPPGLWCWYFCLAAEGFIPSVPSPSPSQWGAETCSKRRAELGNHWSAKRISEDIS